MITIDTSDLLFSPESMAARVDPPADITPYLGGTIENDEFTIVVVYTPEDTIAFPGPYSLEVVSKPESINIETNAEQATITGVFTAVFTDLFINYFTVDKTYVTVGGFGLIDEDKVDEIVRYKPSSVTHVDRTITLKAIDDNLGDIEEFDLIVRIYNDWTIGRDALINYIEITEAKDARSS